jgi:hypothetical protein
MGAAHLAVWDALADGRLAPATACEACGRAAYTTPAGRDGLVWHHHSYAPEHWLDVAALCHSCHRKAHAGSIPDPRTGLYLRARFGITRDRWPGAVAAYAAGVSGWVRRPRTRLAAALHDAAVKGGLLTGRGYGRSREFCPVAA